MTSAVLGSGATLQVDSGSGLATIAEVLRCGPIGSTNPEVDVTNLDSTAKEYIAGLADGNPVEFEMNWVAGDTEQEFLRAQQAAGATLSMAMIWQTSPTTTATFSLVALQFEIGETSPESQITATFSGRISGAIVWS